MKKIMASLLLTSIIISTSTFSLAQPLMIKYDGVVHKYTGNINKLKVNGDIVNTDIPPIIINGRSLVPARAIFEKLGATVKWDASTRKVNISINDTNVELKINNNIAIINKKNVKMEIPAKIINDRTMVPARFVAENLDMKVDYFNDQKLITIDSNLTVTTSLLKDVKYSNSGDICEVALDIDKYNGYKSMTLTNPERLVIDIPNAKVSGTLQKLDINNNVVKSVRLSDLDSETANKVQLPNESVRVVLDVAEQSKYNIVEKKGQLVLQVSNETGVISSQTPAASPAVTPTVTPTPSASVMPTSTPTEPTVTPTIPTPTATSKQLDIKHSIESEYEEVLIGLENYKNYKISTMENPNRIVIDVPYTGFARAEQRKDFNSKYVKSVRYSQNTDEMLRIVIDVTGQPEYKTAELDGQLALQITKCVIKNAIYQRLGDRVCLFLKDAKITEGGQDFKKLYTDKYDSDKEQYTLTFPSNLARLSSEVINVNDEFLNSIEIKSEGDFTNIVFNAKQKLLYNTFTRSDINDTAITILKPSAKDERLVVIDPGHGGTEPGAVFGGYEEKNLNLDISRRLNELLKSKNVKTYMIREDDYFIGLYERAFIANALNAELFISIHNNAYYASSKGTETLYKIHDSEKTASFTSKTFAQIVQDAMISKLGTYNRKIVDRPNLVVLKATNMPAVLAEVAFMTNDEDRFKLYNKDFRQKAAEALCEAIIKSLDEKNK